MVKITDEMKEVAEKGKIWAIATVSKDGIPNVVPVGTVRVLSDDELLIVNNFFKKTEENLNANPDKVAVSIWGIGKGFQFKGEARIETSGSIYDEGLQMVRAKNPQRSPKSVVVMKVKSIYSTTPGPDAGNKLS